jgi:hypothetical protein
MVMWIFWLRGSRRRPPLQRRRILRSFADALHLQQAGGAVVGLDLAANDDHAVEPLFGGGVEGGGVNTSQVEEVAAVHSAQVEIDGADMTGELD